MRRASWTFVVLALVGCTRGRPEPNPVERTTERRTASGLVVGTRGVHGGIAWLGIPYARPPIGDFRWRAPEPPAPWSGARKATELASPCTQLATPFGGIEDVPRGRPAGSEDCLYLNVWAPSASASDRIPVMVWIHGGGNSVGHGGFYDGSNLATTERVVVVTVNYRLGPFGWFRHPALWSPDTSPAERSGNFGTLDLVRALEWVRDNAAAFGGDPANVTIFGESAGGANVASLLVSPLARGLFHRAIAESAGTNASTVEEAETTHRHSAAALVVDLMLRDPTVRERDAARARAAAMPPAELARWLRVQPATALLEAAATGSFSGLLDFPNPIRDGVVLPEDPPFDVLGRRGAYHAVPIVLGTNRDETKLFQFVDPKYVRRWFGVVPRVRDEPTYAADAEYASRIWKAAAADEPAARLRHAQGQSVWVYRFDWDEEPTILGADLGTLVGAAHGLEVPFVFGHFNLGREASRLWTSENRPGRLALSRAMMSYWAEVAYHGDPGRGRRADLPRWEPWSPSFLVLDTPAGGGIRMSSETVTRAQVLGALEQDPRLPDRREKCASLRWPACRMRQVSRDEYRAAGCGECPLDGAS
jgi:para-nitrobenzyl esterase